MITTRTLRSLGLAVLFAGALLAWAIGSLRPMFRASATGADGSAKAPAWELKDLDGKLVKSSDFGGKVVVLDFWATWCPPCKAEIPGFIELHKNIRRPGACRGRYFSGRGRTGRGQAVHDTVWNKLPRRAW